MGHLLVKGDPVRPVAPRLSFPRATRLGLTVAVRLHAGQTPATYMKAADALVHAWKVHAVRVTSPERGLVLLTAMASDPLQRPGLATAPTELLSALIGALESGGAWVMNLRLVPHWLIAGATRSGKSTLLARLITQLATQPVALVGIDCKGGMELGLFARRLSALATCRREAVTVLSTLVVDMQDRMRVCRSAGVRSIWELPDRLRPVPIVVIVDEIAELYLSDGTRESKAEADQCSTLLLRLAQLGAALGLHLVVMRPAGRLRPRPRCHRPARPTRRPDLPPRQRPRHGRDDPGRLEQGRRGSRPVDHGGGTRRGRLHRP